jgi:hypothetical protein
MGIITKIAIYNVKGKSKWCHNFNDLISNKVNIFVAPNGYGKSTITAAFKAAAHGVMKLQKDEYFDNDPANAPSLKIEYIDGHKKEKITSDINQGDISRKFVVYCINSPIVAKFLGKNIGSFTSRSAGLYIDVLNVCEIPPKAKLNYSYRGMSSLFGKGMPNLTDFFSHLSGLRFIVDNLDDIRKCIKQSKLSNFLGTINSNNTSLNLEQTNKHPVLKGLIDRLVSSQQIDCTEALKYIIQIVKSVKDNDYSCIKKALEYQKYKKRKDDIMDRLATFNTTGQSIKVSEKKGKLILDLGSARKMSNGERDILYFVASLISFESSVGSKPAILIIDEIFDYLDGANLLAAQYYLSNMVSLMNSQNKTFFPIIMTHLDPVVFNNYYIKKYKVHYLTAYSDFSQINSDPLARLLILRSDLKKMNDTLAKDIEKNLLHYYPDNWSISKDLKNEINGSWDDSISYREYLYQEAHKYFNGDKYNALAVVIAIRIRVEEYTVNRLSIDKRSEYYEQKGAAYKLEYAEKCSVNLPELCYLLRPLYNDSLHLYSDDSTGNLKKIESAYLKLSSKVVKNIIKELFDITKASNEC